MPAITDIEVIITAAQQHGQDSDPDHEVGDLQEALRLAWSIFTPEQKVEFLADADLLERVSLGGFDIANAVPDEGKRVPVFVIVSGDPSDPDDHFIPGFYKVLVDKDLTDEQKCEVALDHFHDRNGIGCLDDFTIRVISEDGRWLPEMDGYESGSLADRGEYVGDFGDHLQMPASVRTALGLPDGQTV